MGIEEAAEQDTVVPVVASPDFGGKRGDTLHPPIVSEGADGPERVREFAAAWRLVLTTRRLRVPEAEELRQAGLLLPAADRE